MSSHRAQRRLRAIAARFQKSPRQPPAKDRVGISRLTAIPPFRGFLICLDVIPSPGECVNGAFMRPSIIPTSQMFLVDLGLPGSVLLSLGYSGHRWDIRGTELLSQERRVYHRTKYRPLREGEMTANRDPVRERFELPGFVSENRPEFEKVRSISSRSERPLFFARYRHDKPNLGLLEQSPLADQVIVSVELRPFRPINVFCDGHHQRKPASEAGALALYDMRRSWCADIRDPFDTLQVFLPINSFRDFAAERSSRFLDFRYDLARATLRRSHAALDASDAACAGATARGQCALPGFHVS